MGSVLGRSYVAIAMSSATPGSLMSGSYPTFGRKKPTAADIIPVSSSFGFEERTSGDEETGRRYTKGLTLYECLWWGASSPDRKPHLRSEAQTCQQSSQSS